MRSFQKLLDTFWIHKTSVIGFGICKFPPLPHLITLSIGMYGAKRVSRNVKELEENTQSKQLFDPVKAKAQIEVYKEIYNIGAENSEEGLKNKDVALKILQSASDNDI